MENPNHRYSNSTQVLWIYEVLIGELPLSPNAETWKKFGRSFSSAIHRFEGAGNWQIMPALLDLKAAACHRMTLGSGIAKPRRPPIKQSLLADYRLIAGTFEYFKSFIQGCGHE